MPKAKPVARDQTEPLRAVAYVRCSSDKQAEKESSIPAQKVEIERLAARSGATIVRWFQDDGISGKDMLHRAGVTEMLTYIEQNRGQVGALYLYDYKRLARNREDAFYIRKKAAKLQIAIISVAQPIVDDPIGAILQESMYDAWAEIERLNLARVVRRGQEQTLRDGYWPYPRPPYGYRSIGIANSRGSQRFKLVPDPVTGAVVKRIFELQAQGLGQKLIAAALDREGAPCPSRTDVPKERVEGWRATLTRWNRHAAATLRATLVRCEDALVSQQARHAQDAPLAPPPASWPAPASVTAPVTAPAPLPVPLASDELTALLAAYDVVGFPLHMPFSTLQHAADAVHSTGLHRSGADDSELALAVHVHAYPAGAFAVWIYFAELVRKQ